jgi:hypothetical protein
MTLARILAAAITLALLTASAARVAPPPPALFTDYQRAAAATKVTRDEFKKTTKYQGANASTNNSLFLRAWKDDKTKEMTYQIYLTSFYGDRWRFYSEAYDSNGSRLDFTSIDKKVDSCNGDRGCYFEETVGLNVSRKYLEENAETGIGYKISGKAGETTGFLPAAYVKGFLVSIDAAG